jgi:hypothetical protein
MDQTGWHRSVSVRLQSPVSRFIAVASHRGRHRS